MAGLNPLQVLDPDVMVSTTTATATGRTSPPAAPARPGNPDRRPQDLPVGLRKYSAA